MLVKLSITYGPAESPVWHLVSVLLIGIRLDRVHSKVQLFCKYTQEYSARSPEPSRVSIDRVRIYFTVNSNRFLGLVENAHVESIPIEINGSPIRKRRQRTQHPSLRRSVHALQLPPRCNQRIR